MNQYPKHILDVSQQLQAYMDALIKQGKYSGVYQIILDMKYLRPNDEIWNQFVSDLTLLIEKHGSVIELWRINFPSDWSQHMSV